jgi:hypothetical protein
MRALGSREGAPTHSRRSVISSLASFASSGGAGAASSPSTSPLSLRTRSLSRSFSGRGPAAVATSSIWTERPEKFDENVERSSAGHAVGLRIPQHLAEKWDNCQCKSSYIDSLYVLRIAVVWRACSPSGARRAESRSLQTGQPDPAKSVLRATASLEARTAREFEGSAPEASRLDRGVAPQRLSASEDISLRQERSECPAAHSGGEREGPDIVTATGDHRRGCIGEGRDARSEPGPIRRELVGSVDK